MCNIEEDSLASYGRRHVHGMLLGNNGHYHPACYSVSIAHELPILVRSRRACAREVGCPAAARCCCCSKPQASAGMDRDIQQSLAGTGAQAWCSVPVRISSCHGMICWKPVYLSSHLHNAAERLLRSSWLPRHVSGPGIHASEHGVQLKSRWSCPILVVGADGLEMASASSLVHEEAWNAGVAPSNVDGTTQRHYARFAQDLQSKLFLGRAKLKGLCTLRWYA